MVMSDTDHAILHVLADPLRARIVELLADDQLCTCPLVTLTGARPTNVPHTLRAMREAGLIEAEPAGRYTYYRLRPEALDGLADRLTHLAEGARTSGQNRRPCS